MGWELEDGTEQEAEKKQEDKERNEEAGSYGEKHDNV